MKKFLSLLLTFIMIISVLIIVPIRVNATSSEFLGGSGTIDDPYIISNKNHLNNVRNHLDSHFKLICDIEFGDADFTESGCFYNNNSGFIPIGTSSKNAFSGTFDGNGFAIKNLYINYELEEHTVYGGLFGYTFGTIKNLSVLDGIISVSAVAPTVYTITSAYAGGIAGCNRGNIINCYTSCDVLAKSSVLSSRATADSNAGGIVGTNSSGVIENCCNTGKVTASAEKNDDAGGIAGVNSSGIIFNCYNTGTISGDFTGGITGRNLESSSIRNCYNTGSISAYSGSTDRAGGIAGENISTIVECNNSGNVWADDYSGGIVGYHNTGILEKCYNNGEISSDSVSGGIAGEVLGTITTCYNTGTVTGKCSGGITGSNSPITKINNCYNIGTVTATSSARAGGITGYNSWDCTISNCYNVGIVTGTKAGGISGFSYNQTGLTGKVTNCYYLDDISQGVGNGKDTATKCTDEQLKQQETYVNFSFADIWSLDINHEYPYPQLISNWQQQVKSITVLSQPFDNTFIEGLSPNLDGATVKVIYNDETEQIVDIKQWMLNEFDINDVAIQTLEVKIGNIISEDAIELVCVEKTIISIKPVKNSYVLGQALNSDDIKYQIEYNNNTKETKELANATFNYDHTKTGDVTVTVTYRGFSDTFDIVVNERTVKSITLTEPTMLTYCIGENLNLKDGYVRAIFESEDDYTEKIPLDSSMISGYDKNIEGYQTVTVEYGGISKTFMVNVLTHNYDTIVISPDCENNGYTKYTCLRCKNTYFANEIPAGHIEVIDKGYAATHEKEGLTDGSHCSVCNKVIVEQKVIPMIVLIGDADGNGKINILDATAIQKHLVGLGTLTSAGVTLADADQNGKVNILDATAIQKYLVGLNKDSLIGQPVT